MKIIKYINIVLLLCIFVFFIKATLHFHGIGNIILGVLDSLIVIFSILNIITGNVYSIDERYTKTN